MGRLCLENCVSFQGLGGQIRELDTRALRSIKFELLHRSLYVPVGITRRLKACIVADRPEKMDTVFPWTGSF